MELVFLSTPLLFGVSMGVLYRKPKSSTTAMRRIAKSKDLNAEKRVPSKNWRYELRKRTRGTELAQANLRCNAIQLSGKARSLSFPPTRERQFILLSLTEHY